MNDSSIKVLRDHIFKALYNTTYQAGVFAMLIGRWERIDIVTTFLVAITVSGSAVAGWTLWTKPLGKSIWATLAGIASVLSILHNIMKVPARIKEKEDIRRISTTLAIDFETLLQDVIRGLDYEQANSEYKKLRERYSQTIDRVGIDIAETKGLRKRAQAQTDEKLKDYL